MHTPTHPHRHRHRRGLAAALAGLTLLLAGCGSEPTAPGPSASSPSDSFTAGSPGAEPSIPAAQPRVADLVSITAAGGTVTDVPTRVDSPAARRDYAADLAPRAGPQLQRAVIAVDAPSGTEVTATVVAIGCDTPSDVEVTRTAEGYRVEAVPTKPSGVQCFAPVTTIAVVVLPTR